MRVQVESVKHRTPRSTHACNVLSSSNTLTGETRRLKKAVEFSSSPSTPLLLSNTLIVVNCHGTIQLSVMGHIVNMHRAIHLLYRFSFLRLWFSAFSLPENFNIVNYATNSIQSTHYTVFIQFNIKCFFELINTKDFCEQRIYLVTTVIALYGPSEFSCGINSWSICCSPLSKLIQISYPPKEVKFL
jgi:hypothetical protein